MSRKAIALTFDDGPNTVTTPQVLEKLAKHGVCASFFLVGNNISEESSKVARKAFEMGCEINNHSKTHSAFPELSCGQMQDEISFTNEKIIGITGKAPGFFRPPYIAVNDEMFDNISLPFIAGIGCEDWLEEVCAKERAGRILAQAKDGDIILLHDMEGNSQTVEALDIIIPELIAQGYEFVTVTALFKDKGITPKKGIVYSNVFQTTVYA